MVTFNLHKASRIIKICFDVCAFLQDKYHLRVLFINYCLLALNILNILYNTVKNFPLHAEL